MLLCAVFGNEPCLFGQIEPTHISNIVDGRPVHVSEYPSVVYVELVGGRCTGNLIATDWVLTAAHCVNGQSITPPTRVSIEHGSPTHFAVRQVDQVIIHPEYVSRGTGFKNDAALIHITRAFDYLIEEVKLPTLTEEMQQAPSGTVAVAVGWGQLDDGRYPNELQAADMEIETPDTCQSRSPWAEGVVHERTLCAWPVSGVSGLNPGDSGGPLLVSDGEGGWIQVGIASQGGRGRPGYPSVYTRVAAVSSWINETIEQPSDDTAKRFHVFPQIADGGGWQSLLIVTNVSPVASLCTVELHGLTMDRFHDVSGITASSSSTAIFEIPGPGGYRVSPTKNESALASGYATLDCTAPTVAQVLYASRDGSGTTTGMATVFSSQAGRVFQFPVLTPEATLGIAIANDTNMEASCVFVLESPERQNLGQATLPVPSKSTVARFLSEVIPVPGGFTGGSATVSCDQQASVIGLQFDGVVFTTLPPATLDLPTESSDETAKRFHVFPQIADGGGWQSLLLVTNVSPVVSLCTLELHGLTMDRFHDVSGIAATGSTAAFELPKLGGYRVWPTRNESSLVSGYATLDCTAPTVAQVLYASRDGSGTTTGMATVFSSQAGSIFQFPVLTEEATLGFAIANDTNTDASCRFVLENPQRGNLREATLSVPSTSNVARFLQQVFQIPGDFTAGSATVSCDQQVSVIGLQFDGSIFTTLPPATLDLTPLPPDTLDLPPATVTMSASPNSINWGQSTTLTWSSTHAESATITPDIGAVPTSGSVQVSPTSTTTYRITVRGAGRQTARASTRVAVIISERAVLAAERAALTALYDATVGPGWTNSTNWKTAAPLGQWHGVRTDAIGRVIALNLRENELTGTIPPELGNLTRLQELYLNNNDLTGPIPLELGHLTHLLRLDLSQNALAGTIPPELGHLTRLQWLILGPNELTGTIPSELGNLTNLQELHLYYNELIGTIPRELGNLTNLERLWLNGNKLTGTIPSELGNLTNLQELYLSSNELTGTIPPALGRLTNLQDLHLSSNELIWTIPTELGRLTNLYGLHLSYNELTGAIPPSLGNLTNLQKLSLSNNELTGTIPRELGNLTNLQKLHLSYNELTGTIPRELGNLTNLERLWLTGAKLTGTIPSELGNLANLQELSLSNNELTGAIPSSLGNLTNLQKLHLSYNELTGTIPRELGNLTNLERLWLTGAKLTGTIPSELGNLANLQELSLSNNELTGAIPSSLGNLTNLQKLHLSYNELTGTIPRELGNLTNLERLWLTGAKLTGTIPSELGNLANLQELSLSNNELTGAIPSSLGNLTNLQKLHLSYNELTGTIPRELGNLTNLERLWLTGAKLTGTIPSELGNLANLQELSLSNNELTGAIPSSLGNLANLQELHLSSNELTGTIPPALGRLTNLESLGLSNNELTGTIPPALGRLTNLESLGLSNNELTGAIPSSLGDLSKIETLRLHENALSGTLPSSLTNLRQLRTFSFHDNAGLCAPSTTAFQEWLRGIDRVNGPSCSP